MLENSIDLAVHSLKDLPTQQTDGLVLAAVPAREDPADALIAPRYQTLRLCRLLLGLVPARRAGALNYCSCVRI